VEEPHAPVVTVQCDLPRCRSSFPGLPLRQLLPRQGCQGCITDTNRMYLALFGMQNRAFGPYLSATNRILISLVATVRVRDPAHCSCSFHSLLPSAFRD
jgi:hypothetical protein